jgi:cytochrome b
MIIALLAAVTGVGVTGWLFTTDMFWGSGWLQALHQVLAWLMLALVALHVGGVVFSSRLHHEHLIRAMFTGWKPAPQEAERPGRT